ncbi:MAG: isoprenyl transferase [Deltaproteobacteria bacterium]
MTEISREKLPRHIAIIMDGNGRWAGQRFLNRINGHRKGIDAAREVVKCCTELGIECLTLYTFSKENWRRPAFEVQMLMKFLEAHLRAETKTLVENNIRFKAIGNVSDLPQNVRSTVAELESITRNNTAMVLQLALSYSGREEILRSAQELARRVKDGFLRPEDITEDVFKACLYTSEVPDPDLLIRTSGEKRISNFLLWQIAYTEIYITEVLWPDFTREDLKKAIMDFQGRDRRYGLVKAKGFGAAG